MRRWLNRGVRVTINPVGWGFNKCECEDRIRETRGLFIYFFLFQNRLVAAARGGIREHKGKHTKKVWGNTEFIENMRGRKKIITPGLDGRVK